MWRQLLLAFSILVNCFLVYRLVWSEEGVMAYKSLKEQHAALTGRMANLDGRNRELSREIRLLMTDARYQEKVVRKRLNFVRDNEILYTFSDPDYSELTGAGSDERKD